MGKLNMRINPEDSRFFSPDRDLAYCSHNLVKRAIAGLDPDRQEPWVIKYLESQSVTDDQLCDGAVSLAQYLGTSVLDPIHKTPFEALEAVGFFKLPEAVQTIVLAKIGQVYMSAFFTSIRDVTRDPTSPPYKIEDFHILAGDFTKKAAKYRGMWQCRRWLGKKVRHLRKRLGI